MLHTRRMIVHPRLSQHHRTTTATRLLFKVVSMMVRVSPLSLTAPGKMENWILNNTEKIARPAEVGSRECQKWKRGGVWLPSRKRWNGSIPAERWLCVTTLFLEMHDWKAIFTRVGALLQLGTVVVV